MHSTLAAGSSPSGTLPQQRAGAAVSAVAHAVPRPPAVLQQHQHQRASLVARVASGHSAHVAADGTPSSAQVRLDRRFMARHAPSAAADGGMQLQSTTAPMPLPPCICCTSLTMASLFFTHTRTNTPTLKHSIANTGCAGPLPDAAARVPPAQACAG